MKLTENTRNWLKFTLAAVGTGYLVMGVFSLFGRNHLAWNNSPSTPIGWYLKTKDPHAQFVSFCLEGDALSQARLHGLPAGSCRNGSAPLMKPVLVFDQPILLTPEGAIVGGRLLPNTKPKPVGVDGLPLHHYPYGTYQQRPDQFWVLSTFNANSFDSRYFGPVSRTQIVTYARGFILLPWLH